MSSWHQLMCYHSNLFTGKKNTKIIMKRSCSATGIPFLQVLLVLAKIIPKFMKVYKVCWYLCLLVKDYEGFTKQYRDGGHWWTDRYQSETFISFFYKVWTSLKLTTTAMTAQSSNEGSLTPWFSQQELFQRCHWTTQQNHCFLDVLL